MIYRNQATYALGYAGVAQAPDASGVYTIFSSRRWVYVGESDDIRQSLFRHLNESAPCMHAVGPLSFSFELAAGDRRVALGQSLAAQLKPTCNRRPSARAAHDNGRRRSWLSRVWTVLSGSRREGTASGHVPGPDGSEWRASDTSESVTVQNDPVSDGLVRGWQQSGSVREAPGARGGRPIDSDERGRVAVQPGRYVRTCCSAAEGARRKR